MSVLVGPPVTGPFTTARTPARLALLEMLPLMVPSPEPARTRKRPAEVSSMLPLSVKEPPLTTMLVLVPVPPALVRWMAPAMVLLPALLMMPELALPALVLNELRGRSVMLVLLTLPSRTRAAVPVRW